MARANMTEDQFALFQSNLNREAPAKGAKRPTLTKDERDALPENQVKKQCIDFLEAIGFEVFRNHVGVYVPYRIYAALNEWIDKQEGPRPRAGGWDVVTVNEKGTPDWKAERMLRTRPGIVERFWIELKAPGKTPSKNQWAWIRKHRPLGHLVEYFDCLEDEDGFNDGHALVPWVKKHFARSPGGLPGEGW